MRSRLTSRNRSLDDGHEAVSSAEGNIVDGNVCRTISRPLGAELDIDLGAFQGEKMAATACAARS